MNEETVGSYFHKNFKPEVTPSRCFVSYQNFIQPTKIDLYRQGKVIYILRNSNGTYSYQTISSRFTWGGINTKVVKTTYAAKYKTTLMLCYAERIDPETLIGLN